MRILFTSDWHIDNRTRGFDRSADVLAAIRHMVQEANDADVDVFVFGGDLLDGHAPDDRCWGFLTAVKYELLQFRRQRYVLVAGNHDMPDREGARSCLAPLEDPVTTVADNRKGTHVMFTSQSGVAAPYCDIICLPHGMEQQQVEDLLRECLTSELVSQPFVVVSHLEVPGILEGSEIEMPRGKRSAQLPLWILDEPACAGVFQSHYHTAQEITGKACTLYVVGSPVLHRFDEEGDVKGYLIADIP